MAERKPKSSWQRQGKSSFVYSPIYQMWKAEAKKNGASSSSAIALSCRHARSVGVDNTACTLETEI